MACEWYHFLIAMLLLLFSVCSIIVGLFAVYFAGGKTKVVSIVFVIIGLIVLFLFLWFSWCIPFMGTPPIELCGCVTKAFAGFIGGIIGILLSIGFLIVIFLKL